MVTLTHVTEVDTMLEAVNMVKGALYVPEWVYNTDNLDAFIVSTKAPYHGRIYVDTMTGEIRDATKEEHDRFCIEG
jgi:hypothetical protein